MPTATTAPVELTLNCDVDPTAKSWVGPVVPMPTLPVEPINRKGEVEGAVLPIPTLPTDCRRILPDVNVFNVKSPLVLLQEEAPPETKVMAPVVFPIPTVFPPVADKVVLPETVKPPVP